MGLNKEEKAQLEALTAKSKEPDGPPQGVNFTLDLSSDTAWERAKQLGIVREPEAEGEGGEDDEDADDAPKRRGRGSGYFGNS
jgi:hypothetical protein